jgi:hypothetical protein
LDLDGLFKRPRWLTLKNAAKWGGVLAAGACVVGTGGACGVLVAGAIGLSAANNANRARHGEISVGQATMNGAVDAFGSRFNAVRSLGTVRPQHGQVRGMQSLFGNRMHADTSIRRAFRGRLGRSSLRTGVQSYYGQRAYSERDGF